MGAVLQRTEGLRVNFRLAFQIYGKHAHAQCAAQLTAEIDGPGPLRHMFGVKQPQRPAVQRGHDQAKPDAAQRDPAHKIPEIGGGSGFGHAQAGPAENGEARHDKGVRRQTVGKAPGQGHDHAEHKPARHEQQTGFRGAVALNGLHKKRNEVGGAEEPHAQNKGHHRRGEKAEVGVDAKMQQGLWAGALADDKAHPGADA